MKPSIQRPAAASFYRFPSGLPSGAVCRGTACFVARRLNPERWKDTGPSACHLGKCFAGPATEREDPRPHVEVCAREAVVLSNVARGGARTLGEYVRSGGYGALKKALPSPPGEVLRTVEVSELRGRGGAGFPTGRKWRAVATQTILPKYVVANADEGDPGAYIDRLILEDDPHRLLEGMALAAHAVGASKGYIYLRAEYPKAQGILRGALEEARRSGLLGPSFDVELISGHGSYVCGEETALLDSIEGKRPFVRPRPPYPTERGLFGKPTVVNNVETLAAVPWIVERGGEAHKSLGFSRSRGTKAVSLNSLFVRPGLYEVEFGIPVRRILEELGGGLKTGPIRGVLIGGPLAGVLPPELFDTPFGFEELRAVGASVGHGGIVAFDGHTSIRDLVDHVFEFGANESCGRCIPCRVGNRRIESLLKEYRLTRGEWNSIVSALASTSLCGLGAGIAEFARSIERHYPRELEACFA